MSTTRYIDLIIHKFTVAGKDLVIDRKNFEYGRGYDYVCC